MNGFKLKVLSFFILSIIIGVAITLFLSKRQDKDELTRGENYKPGISEVLDKAVNQAKHVYSQNKKLGVDFSSGPCLTNALMPGWVADIAHNPRIAIDNLPENQCQVYLEGRAAHFVELDLEGNLIRAK